MIFLYLSTQNIQKFLILVKFALWCPKVVLAKFFLTPKMFELKEEEEYKEITDIVINFYLNRFCIKCGYETKK